MQYDQRVATQAERRANTRKAILAAAREHFARSGYHETSVSDILESAGVSRGAMYHHFSSKEELFAVIYVQTSSAAIRAAAERVGAEDSPREGLVAGCLAWLDVVSEPTIGRLLFTEGPIALGWQRCRSLEDATALRVLRARLEAANDAGQITIHSVDVTARLLNALLAEAALLESSKGATSRIAVAADLEAMINGLAR